MMFDKLFSSLKIGRLTIPNRFIMAPLTRCRADPDTFIPNDLMAEYYSQRAKSAGLVITEYTTVTEKAVTFHTEGCIYNDAQAEGWKKVTSTVHDVGGRMFCQLAHGGRAAHPLNNGGEIPVAPSPIGLTHRTGAEFNPTGKKVDNVVPRELTDDEAREIVDDFVKAAGRAMDAGFDGVEIHGANGYLINQFYCENSNKRTSGRYSGETMETRCRFLFDILEGVAGVVGADRMGLRISPLGSYQDMHHDDPVAVTEYIATKCSDLGLAYLHVIRGDLEGKDPYSIDIVTPARKTFKNTLVVNMGFEAEEAEKELENGKFDAVAFGTKFLANPDYPERVLAGAKLNQPDMATFYGKTAKGYTGKWHRQKIKRHPIYSKEALVLRNHESTHVLT